MRKLIVSLMIAMSCFAVTAVSAQEESISVVSSEETSAPSEVAVDVSVTDSLHGSDCPCGKPKA